MYATDGEDVGSDQGEVGTGATGVDVRLRDREVEALQPEQRVLLGELLRDLVAADLGEVVALGLKNRFSSSARAESGVGGSPGRSLR